MGDLWIKKIEEEKKYLEKVKGTIIYFREKLVKDFADVAIMYKGRYNQVKWGDEDLVKNQQSIIENKRKKMFGLEFKPYFGKFVFQEKHFSPSSVYIGKTNINDADGNILVTDWRTPICSLFYEQSIGMANYESPMGNIFCDLLEKYQIQIENGELLNVINTDLVTNDEILSNFLSNNNESRLKNIVASIQSEQNAVIRKPINLNLIIQGVAGSGKTTVALHRAAYLLYNNDNLSPEDFMFFGPNKYFLNYISALLPDLDTENISQFTFEEFTKYYFDNKIRVYNTKDEKTSIMLKILKFKSSIKFKLLIDKFLEAYLENVLSKDIKIGENILFKKEFIRNSIKNDSISYSAENTQKYLISKVKDDKDYYDDLILLRYRQILKTLSVDDKLAIDIRKFMDYAKGELKNNCSNIIKEYFKPLRIKPIELYEKFIKSISQISDFKDEETELLKKSTLISIIKGEFSFEELPALIYFNTKINGKLNNDYSNYRHVIVDEAQDFGEFHYYILKKVFKNATFSIFGDSAQSIYPGRGVENWKEICEIMDLSNYEFLKLSKSYRTTKEITLFANNILKYLGIDVSNPVMRDGKDVDIINAEDADTLYKLIIESYNIFINCNYKSFGIICKNRNECTDISNYLTNIKINNHLINEYDIEYNDGISILTAELSKGLEFDKVLVINVDSNNYFDNVMDMKLLYVACTRALHELTISYRNNLVLPFKESCINENQLTLKK